MPEEGFSRTVWGRQGRGDSLGGSEAVGVTGRVRGTGDLSG